MGDFRIYLEKLQKSLVRQGYSIPCLTDYSVDGLYRFAKMLEEVYNLINFDDFFGRMQEQFYREYVIDRDEKIRKGLMNETVAEEHKMGVSESLDGVEEDEPNTVWGEEEDLDEPNMDWEENIDEPNVSWDENIDEPNNDWEENIDEPNVRWDEGEDEDLDEPNVSWGEGEDEDLDEPNVSWDEDDYDAPSGSWGEEDEDLDEPNVSWDEDGNIEEPSLSWDSVNDADDSNLEEEDHGVFDVSREIKEFSRGDGTGLNDQRLNNRNKYQREELQNRGISTEEAKNNKDDVNSLPEIVKKNNQTIDMIGSLFGGTKRRKK